MSIARMRQRGLGKFEFAIVAALLGILAAVLLDRLIDLERQAEQLEVELALRNLRIGLKLAIGEKVIRGEEAHIGALLEADPLALMGIATSKAVAGETAPPWRYDPASRMLIYHPRQPAAFDGREELCWRLVPLHDASGRTTGIAIETLK